MNAQEVLTRHSELNPKHVIVVSISEKGETHYDISVPTSIGDLLFMQKIVNIEIDRAFASSIKRQGREG